MKNTTQRKPNNVYQGKSRVKKALMTATLVGAGLSSSAALIVGILKLTASLSKKTVDNFYMESWHTSQ